MYVYYHVISTINFINHRIHLVLSQFSYPNPMMFPFKSPLSMVFSWFSHANPTLTERRKRKRSFSSGSRAMTSARYASVKGGLMQSTCGVAGDEFHEYGFF